MRHLFLFFLTIAYLSGFGQNPEEEIDLLSELEAEISEEPPVVFLPEKMLLSQRVLWGEKGLYRKIGIAPKVIDASTREKELKVRRTMFKIHQAAGLITAGGMLAQGIVGTRLYNGQFDLINTHKTLASGINIAYGTTALMAFAAPPPLINRKKFDNIKLHKWLSVVHLSGMVATNILAEQTDQGPRQKTIHKWVGIGTFATYSAAILSIKFEF